MIRRPPRLLVVALAVQLVIGGAFVWLAARDFDLDGGDDDPQAREPFVPRPTADRFDERYAFALLRRQVERYGWRPAGSRALRRLAEDLRRRLPNGRFEPLGREHPRLRNVVGIVPGGGPAIVVGAHYDVEARPRGFVGANDGAAGTAAVVALARTMARARRPADAPELRFVLFDGEEEPAGCRDFARCGLRGSRAYVRDHRDEEIQAMILLDYVGSKRLRLPREGSSDEALWTRVRAAARQVGVAKVFPLTSDVSLLDDHVPFIEQGIPAVDLIDWQYPYKDTLRDTVDKTSPASLDAVGETVAHLLLHWDR
jgi:glutaminyl-peptide cyclotransferase